MKLNKRSLILLVSLVALLVITVGGTLAYIAVSTGSLTNIFNPSKVEVTIHDDGTIENTGNAPAYVRVAIVANWQDSNDVVYAKAPSYTVNSTVWTKGSDGFYYYTQVLQPEGSIPVVVTPGDGEGAPTGYVFKVEILASAIQATSDAVSDWSTAVKVENGILIPKTN